MALFGKKKSPAKKSAPKSKAKSAPKKTKPKTTKNDAAAIAKKNERKSGER